MVIISHDRHFLNQVCTHVADLDFQQLKIYPGNYDDFMLASVQARGAGRGGERQGQGPDLRPAGVRAALFGETRRRRGRRPRARSNWRRSRSRKSGLPRARIPYIRFEQGKKLYRSAMSVEKLSFRYPDTEEDVLHEVTFNVEAGERVAVIGPNGAGKTTLMRCLAENCGRRRDASCGSKTPRRATCRRIPRRSSRTRPIYFRGCRNSPARRMTIRSSVRPWDGCCFREKRPRNR